MVVTIILFLIMFGVLVISHEFGHFIIGKLNNIRVNEFTVGMGPVLLHFTKGETRYTLRLLPFGGACIFDGDDPDKADVDVKDERAFPNANVWRRIATIVAGPAFNFIVAFFCSLIVVAFSGSDKPIIQKIMPDSAAQECGLQAGDLITKINGERIHVYREVSIDSAMNMDGESMEIQYERNGKLNTVLLTPKYSEEDERYYIGLQGGGEFFKCNPIQVFQYSFYELRYWAKYTFKSLGMLIRGKIGVDSLTGPVGMAEFVGETYEEVKPYGLSSIILTMMNLMILLSVNLGILNLLPLPALDGGRLVFMIVEVLRGKPIPPEKEGMVHLIGMAGFFLLMIVVMYNDIMKLFR